MKTLTLAATLIATSFVGAVRAESGCGYDAGCSEAGGCTTCGGGYGAAGSAGVDSYKQNIAWPNPYVRPARRGICQSMAIMVNNGWRRQNLMGSYHFDPKDPTQLTEAGRLKAAWILTQTPPDRRMVFVERGENETETANRVQAVQQYAANLSPGVGAVAVQETHLRNEGHPAGSVDAVFTGFTANQMPPVLPQDGGGSSGESSGQ